MQNLWCLQSKNFFWFLFHTESVVKCLHLHVSSESVISHYTKYKVQKPSYGHELPYQCNQWPMLFFLFGYLQLFSALAAASSNCNTQMWICHMNAVPFSHLHDRCLGVVYDQKRIIKFTLPKKAECKHSCNFRKPFLLIWDRTLNFAFSQSWQLHC